MRKNKKRCSETGCTGIKSFGDERCLKHIHQKYAPIWYKSFGSVSNSPNQRYNLDTIDNNDTDRV